MKKCLFWITNIIVPLLIGTVVYCLYRPDTYVTLWITKLLDVKIYEYGISNTVIGKLLRFYFADMVWAYSLFFGICLFVDKPNRYRKTFLICIVFEIVLESMQLLGICNGTFDIADILVEIFANFVAYQIITLREKIYEN